MEYIVARSWMERDPEQQKVRMLSTDCERFYPMGCTWREHLHLLPFYQLCRWRLLGEPASLQKLYSQLLVIAYDSACCSFRCRLYSVVTTLAFFCFSQKEILLNSTWSSMDTVMPCVEFMWDCECSKVSVMFVQRQWILKICYGSLKRVGRKFNRGVSIYCIAFRCAVFGIQ